MKHWVVIGRILGDLENSAGVFHAETEWQARNMFIEWMNETRKDDVARAKEAYDCPTGLTIIACMYSDSPIHLTYYR